MSSTTITPTLQEQNITRVQSLVAEFQNGNPAGYMEGVSPNVTGSMLGGLIPGAENIKNKEEFMAIMNQIGEYMEVKKFEPTNWNAYGDDVIFQVNWIFVWKKTGVEHETTALVRKVLKDGMICEKYHMVDTEAIVGEKSPHGDAVVKRVQELLTEYQEGRPEGYLAGVADDIKADMFNGLLPEADKITNKEGFMGVMGTMDKFMAVTKFAPREFRALPNNDMMMLVDWQFKWLATGKEVETTAIVRKVLDGNNNICEKYHMLDNPSSIVAPSPRNVIEADA